MLVYIVEDDEGNQKVEEKRGQLFWDATIVDVAPLPTNDDNMALPDLENDNDNVASL